MIRLHIALAGFVLAAVSVVTTPAAAQWDPAIEQALAAAEGDRVRVTRDRVRPQWLPDGTRFWYAVDLQDGKREFVLVDAENGDIQRADALTNLGLAADEPLRTSSLPLRRLRTRSTGGPMRLEFSNQLDQPLKLYWIDPQNRQQPYGELPAGEQRVQNTYEGHVWLVTDLDDRRVASIEANALQPVIEIDGPAQAVPVEAAPDETRDLRSGPGRSPDGLWSVDFREHNAILTRLSDATEIQLTDDGDTQHPYRGPAHWAPDSAAVVLTHVREPAQRRITLVESSPPDQLQPVTREVTYAKPGDELPEVRPVLFRIGAAETVDEEQRDIQRLPISDELFPQAFNESGRLNVRWAADSSECYFDYNQRGHQLYRIIALNAHTGETRVVIEERSDTFIDYTNKTWRHWLADRREVLWMSERDGWNHLLLYDIASGQPVRQITQGRWVVRSVEHVDEQRQQIWFLASGLRADEDPYYLHLCRVNFDGSGMTQLTQADGTHDIQWSPDRQWFLATWSRVDHPPVTELRRSDDGALVAPLEQADASELLASGWSMPERFVAQGRDGQTDIHGIIIRPQPFDPERNYPVIEEVYAGPHGAFVPKSFGRLSRQQAFARLGFVVVQVDGMGTNHRGRAFHCVAWKNLQDAGFPDRISWIRAAAQERPWLDLSHVGIYGGSAGGQTAMRALLDHHDFYHAAAADCGCHDNRIDKRWWNEQWLGWPLDDSYVAASNVEHAHRLQGSLLLIVGELDQNVDPASTLQVVDRLVRANKPFEFLMIPGTGHGAAETPYGSRRRLEFFYRHLGHSNDEP